jgi:curli biogenesis system outer membrane secretion channel CsgG
LLSVCLLLVATGCVMTPAQMEQMSQWQPRNYAKSPNFASRTTWRTAVLPPAAAPGADAVPAAGLYDYAGMALMRTGRFTVVDRSAVDKLLAEQEFSSSGVVDPASAARLGRMLGAESVVLIDINTVKHDEFFSNSPEQRDAMLHVKVISVETTEILYSAQGEASSFDGATSALQGALDTALIGINRP